MAKRDHLVFYDRDCGFCRRMMRIVLKRDAKRGVRLDPIALQDQRAAHELAGIDEETRMASWHLKDPAGRVTSGGAALPPSGRSPGPPPFRCGRASQARDDHRSQLPLGG